MPYIYVAIGRKQIGTFSSADRRQNVTVVCGINTMDTYVPSALICPR